MTQHEQTSARFPGSYSLPEIEIPEFTRHPRRPDWITKHWTILAALVAGGIAWGTLTASVAGKLDKDEYAKDQAVREQLHARENATRDSIAGQTLNAVLRIGRKLCPNEPGGC